MTEPTLLYEDAKVKLIVDRKTSVVFVVPMSGEGAGWNIRITPTSVPVIDAHGPITLNMSR